MYDKEIWLDLFDATGQLQKQGDETNTDFSRFSVSILWFTIK